MSSRTPSATSKRLALRRNVLLWGLQGFLALFFAGASGAPKLLMPTEMLPMALPLPSWFIHLVGTCEVLGALGLVLPMLPPVRRLSTRLGLSFVGPRLTVLAAACLVMLTICATVYQVVAEPEKAVFPPIFGALCAIVAIARGRDLQATRSTAPSQPWTVATAR